mmetsp:Transcript_17714/g.26872  ORF Transcript_17714/g.26872 Transcript_17714/m.26872 type:complete len:1124 (+) Transcript_17714:623-3994(+)
MMMENESIGSEKARDGPLHHHHGHDVRVVTSTKKCPSPVTPSTNSTDQNPAQVESSSETTEEKEKGHGEEKLSKESSTHPSQEEERNNSPCPDTPNDLQIVGYERTMTTSTTNPKESEANVEQSPMIMPTPNDTLNSALEIQDSISSDEFMRSPKVQNAIVERSPEGRYVRFLEKLGSGASKDVYRAYDTQEGIEVAWNVVQLSGVPKLERNRIVNEVRLLERLHHPNIISFHGSWVNRERQEVNFVTEILSSGTLSKFIAKVQVIRWKIAKRWATQILKGLEYLHSQDPPVIHRDLKCENIFINGTSGDLRIGDLGLSTVHSTGKVLSVLGTPEFMAPDLYEESSYDEKVDIYAFGMCLLEILTKETPYRECSNPAQIYKKVMKGDRPESLQRLRSKMARDFITLCLGFRDEASGKYIRPSACELLKHQFLFKSKNDDSEVIVDPPLQERTIAESPTLASHKVSVEGAMLDEVPLPLSRPRNSDSTVDCESDEFEEMPDSEINIKKVKVLMGRNEELKEDENERLSNTQMASSDSNPNLHVSAKLASSLITADNTGFQKESQQRPPPSQVAESTEGTPHSSIQTFLTNDAPGFTLLNSNSSMHHVQTSSSIPSTSSALSNASNQLQRFLVSTSVVEDVSAAMPHYQDDILKLIVTLPVDGQKQNVQFDFHLVEDDPVEVAREMVSELGIPLEATLEIGGTISALAREARIKQGQHRQQQQIPQSVVAANAPLSLGHETPGAKSMYQSQQSSHIVQMQQMFQAQPPYQVVQPQHKQFIPTANDSTPATNEFLDGNSIYQPHQIMQSQQPQRVGSATIPTVENEVANLTHQAHHSTQFVHTQPNTNATQPLSISHENPNSNQTFQSQQAPQVAQPQSVHGPGTVQRQVSSATPPPPQLPTGQDSVHMTSMQSIATENNMLASQQAKPSLQAFPQTLQHVVDEVNLYEMNAETAELPELITDNQSGRLPYQPYVATIKTDMSELTLSDPSNDHQIMQLINNKDLENHDEEDEGMTEELKRLHDHFHKDLLRAEKVHDIRMDNLRRAKLEKEQRHIQTLEKHEKEKMQFEKRVQQEAKEQSKRLEKIQLKYKSERQKLVEKNKQGGSVSTSSSPTQDMFDPNPEIL